MNKTSNTCKRKLALFLSCIMMTFAILGNARPVFAESAVVIGTSGSISWTLDTLTGKLTIQGSGTLQDVSNMLGTSEDSIRRSTQVKEIVVEEGITALGLAAFANGERQGSSFRIGNRWQNLVSVTLPNSITSIPGGAFYQCNALKTINLPQAFTSIGDYAFSDTGVVDITIPDTVQYISSSAFMNCSDLTSLKLPESFGVDKLSKHMFFGCAGLYDENGFLIINNVLLDIQSTAESIVIPDSVTAIGSSVLTQMSPVKELTLPEGITTIGPSAFSYTKLEKVIIPSTVQTIGDYAFSENTELKEISLPSDIQYIGNHAFAGCEKLTQVNFPKKPTKTGYDIFTGCTALLDDHDVVVFHDTIYGKESLYEESADFYIASNITDIAVSVPRTPNITLESGNTSFLLQDGSLYSGDYSTLWHAQMIESSNGKSQTFKVQNGCKRIAYAAISSGGFRPNGETPDIHGYYINGEVTIPPSVTMIEQGNLFETIKGMDGSYAQQYAQYHYLNFMAIEMYSSLPADVNDDGQVTLADAQLVLKAALKIITLSESAQAVANMNEDNSITLDDAQIVLKGALKIIVLPAGEKLTVDSVIYDEFRKPMISSTPPDAHWRPAGGNSSIATGDSSGDSYWYLLLMLGAVAIIGTEYKKSRTQHKAVVS